MPQMDSTTFFPQVFWLILLISFSFFFFLKTFFSYSIRILKLKNKFIFSILYYFNFFFKNILSSFSFLSNIFFFKYIYLLSKNNTFYNWVLFNFSKVKKCYSFTFIEQFIAKYNLKIS